MAEKVAITRAVSGALARCELTHLDRTPIDVERARSQHAAYEDALRTLGCRVEQLSELPEHGDSVFVEDTAIVLDEIAVLTRPGAVSRRGEVDAIAPALAPYRSIVHLRAPATLDGGDVLRLGRRVFVGLSSRSNRAAVDELAAILAPHAYSVEGVELGACLHLKTAVTEVAPGVVLANPQWIDPSVLGDVEALEVDPAEPFAANAIAFAGRLLYPLAFPRTADRLKRHGLDLLTVEVDELAKAEGAVTCCSLIFSA
jgi:dimethylargininase